MVATLLTSCYFKLRSLYAEHNSVFILEIHKCFKYWYITFSRKNESKEFGYFYLEGDEFFSDIIYFIQVYL